MNVFNPYVAGQISTTANIAALNTPSAIASTQATGASTSSFALSPESLLYYCSSRLDSIDKQIDSYFKEQKAKNQASKELGDVQSILGRTSFQLGGKEEGFDPNVHASESNELLKVYREAQSPEGKQAAADAFKLRSGHDVSEYADPNSQVSVSDINNAKENIAKQDPAQWANRIDNIKTESGKVSKSAELNMIQLQSLVSQRQLAVQLTTQLMQAVHESLKGIVSNTRAG